MRVCEALRSVRRKFAEWLLGSVRQAAVAAIVQLADACSSVWCSTGHASSRGRRGFRRRAPPTGGQAKGKYLLFLPYPEYSAPGDLRQDPAGAVESLASAGLSDRGQNFLE